jgi:hypothetical protein
MWEVNSILAVAGKNKLALTANRPNNQPGMYPAILLVVPPTGVYNSCLNRRVHWLPRATASNLRQQHPRSWAISVCSHPCLIRLDHTQLAPATLPGSFLAGVVGENEQGLDHEALVSAVAGVHTVGVMGNVTFSLQARPQTGTRVW